MGPTRRTVHEKADASRNRAVPTDEDGFRAVADLGGIAVVIRGEDDDRPTIAEAGLGSPADVQRFLDESYTAITDRHRG